MEPIEYLRSNQKTRLFKEVNVRNFPKVPRPPEVQKVEVINPPENKEVIFPEVQRVEVMNPSEKVTHPEVQKVEVINHPEPQKIEIPVGDIIDALHALENLLKAEQFVTVTNPANPAPFPDTFKVRNLPTGVADKPGLADPTTYVPVRLTDGKNFYRAIDKMMAAIGGGGNASSVGNNPQTGQVSIVTTGTQVALSSASARIMNGVIVQARSTNTANIYVGETGVANGLLSGNRGFELQPGQAVSCATNDLSKLFANGTSGDGVCYISSN